MTGSGNDVVFGGDGTDKLDFHIDPGQFDDITVDLRLAVSQNTGVGVKTLSSIENLYTEFGNDDLIGNDVRNRIDSGAGDDTVRGLDGDDRLNGQNGDDTITGGDGNDRIDGGDGVDRIDGGAGDDILISGLGGEMGGVLVGDVLIGGAGADQFMFKSGFEGADRILDFEDGDTIDLSRIDANKSLSGNQSFKFGDLSEGPGHVEITYNAQSDETVIAYISGSRRFDPGMIILEGQHQLTEADFVL